MSRRANRQSRFLEGQAAYLQYSQVAAQGFEEQLQGVASPEQQRAAHINPSFAGGMHINPNFQKGGGNGIAEAARQQVLVNPNFAGKDSSSSSVAVAAGGKNVHVNPNFANRPLPPVPGRPAGRPEKPIRKTPSKSRAAAEAAEPLYANVHVNPAALASSHRGRQDGGALLSSLIDQEKKSKFEDAIRNNVETSRLAAVGRRLRSSADNIVELRKKSAPPEKPKRNSILVNPDFARKWQPPPAAASFLPESSATVPPPAAAAVARQQNTPPQEEKENVSVRARNFLFTPLRKTPFKKIGTRKIVRKKSISPQQQQQQASSPRHSRSFKKIGSRKLVRVKKQQQASTPDSAKRVYKVKTKTKIVKRSPAVANSSSGRPRLKFNFATPLSVKRRSIFHKTPGSGGGKKLNRSLTASSTKKPSLRSRFKLDRRSKRSPTTTTRPPGDPPPVARLRKAHGLSYQVGVGGPASAAAARSPFPKVAPPKPTRNVNIYRPKLSVVNPTMAATKQITVQGVKFEVTDNGRKLKRVVSVSEQPPPFKAAVSPVKAYGAPPPVVVTSSSSSSSPVQSGVVAARVMSPVKSVSAVELNRSGRAAAASPVHQPLAAAKHSPARQQLNTSVQSAQRKVYLGGEEFDEIEPGVFTRSRHSLTRQSLTQAKQKSINIILKSQNRSKQYCMFYNKFGKCNKRQKGSCPYIHDPEKIAVCRRFLQGACRNEGCLLSHKVAPEKMPTCKFFLEGVCTRDDCPYLHVKVSAEADVCSDFLKGYCPNGGDCQKKHVIACPEFDKTGSCRKGDRCPFPHVTAARRRPKEAARRSAAAAGPPPAKPKRKSLGQTPDHTLKKSRVAARYYQDAATAGGDKNELAGQAADEHKATETPASESAATTTAADGPSSAALEAKRKRLLKKVELAASQQQPAAAAGADVGPAGLRRTSQYLDDSGPYEKVDSSSEDEALKAVSRPPVGLLEDFISLAPYSSDEEELNSQRNDRLI